jgi:hypothetical protein
MQHALQRDVEAGGAGVSWGRAHARRLPEAEGDTAGALKQTEVVVTDYHLGASLPFREPLVVDVQFGLEQERVLPGIVH